jgi:hypothetical protein
MNQNIFRLAATLLCTSLATSTFALPDIPKTPQAHMVWAKTSNYKMLFRQKTFTIKRPSNTVTKEIEEYFTRCIKGRVQQLVRRNGSVFDETAYTTGRSKSGGYTYIYGKRHRLIKNDIVQIHEPVIRIKNANGATELTITRQINNGPTEKNILATAKGKRRGCASLAL